MHYFEQLQKDYSNLGLETVVTPKRHAHETTIPIADITSYEGAYLAARLTYGLTPDQLLPEYTALTDLGNAITLATTNSILFSGDHDNYSFDGCIYSEINLVRSLRQVSSRNSIILQKRGTNVAYIKGSGDPSAYALADLPEIGLIHGTFGSFDKLINPERIVSKAKPYLLEVDVLEAYTPIRFSTTLMPLAPRRILETYNEREENASRLTHEAVVDRVNVMAKSATLLTMKDFKAATA